MWLLEASWWKVIKALSLYKIVHVNFFFFLTRGAVGVARICIWLAGPVHWHRFMLSLIIKDNIIKVSKYFQEVLHSDLVK